MIPPCPLWFKVCRRLIEPALLALPLPREYHVNRLVYAVSLEPSAFSGCLYMSGTDLNFHIGDKVVMRCIAGCRRHLQESLLVGGRRNKHGTITISPPLPLLDTTRIEMQVLARGRVTRFAQYRFVRMRRGVIAYVAHQGCLSSTGRSLLCP